MLLTVFLHILKLVMWVRLFLNCEAIDFHKFFCIGNKLLLLLLGLQGPGVFLMASDLHIYREVCMLLAIGFWNRSGTQRRFSFLLSGSWAFWNRRQSERAWKEVGNFYIFWLDSCSLFGFCCWNSLGTNFSHFVSQENPAVDIYLYGNSYGGQKLLLF